jgi:phosphohistidine phosphatase SixA
MHTLYLLRHAKSSWADPTLLDHERPLAPRGRRDAKRIATHLAQLGIEPELVLCSTAARTRETLELVRPALVASGGPELGRLETKFPTAALATLTLPTATWQRLSTADAVLAAYAVPKELG